MVVQQQTFDGSFNVGVQAQGDGITVTVGLPYLHLDRRHLRLRPVRRDLDLLNPYSRSVPLVSGRRGRRDQLRRGWPVFDGAPSEVVSSEASIRTALIGQTAVLMAPRERTAVTVSYTGELMN